MWNESSRSVEKGELSFGEAEERRGFEAKSSCPASPGGRPNLAKSRIKHVAGARQRGFELIGRFRSLQTVARVAVQVDQKETGGRFGDSVRIREIRAWTCGPLVTGQDLPQVFPSCPSVPVFLQLGSGCLSVCLSVCQLQTNFRFAFVVGFLVYLIAQLIQNAFLAKRSAAQSARVRCDSTCSCFVVGI